MNTDEYPPQGTYSQEELQRERAELFRRIAPPAREYAEIQGKQIRERLRELSRQHSSKVR